MCQSAKAESLSLSFSFKSYSRSFDPSISQGPSLKSLDLLTSQGPKPYSVRVGITLCEGV